MSTKRERRELSPHGPRSQAVVEKLRKAIVSGQLVDGERLIEDRLANELETSRGPVREALRQLEAEGLVVSIPYRGATVVSVSEEEVREVLIPIRLILERFSFLKAREEMAEADFAELAKEVWTMRVAAEDGDLARSVEADIRFHEFVLERSSRPHTVQIWRSITPRMRAYFYRDGADADLGRVADDHEALLNALRSRDRRVLTRLLKHHIRDRAG